MVSIIFLAISAICFIATFGCHAILKGTLLRTFYPGPPYLSNQLLSSIPWISGFILAVIPECLIFPIAWYWMFLINVAAVFVLGKTVTRLYLSRWRTGKGLGRDVFVSFRTAIVTLIIGLILRGVGI